MPRPSMNPLSLEDTCVAGRNFQWLPGAREALRSLHEAGYRVVVVSNQAGVGRGVMTESQLLEIHERMKTAAAQAGGQTEAIYYCPHDWDSSCECRKPQPGLLFRAQRELNLDLSRTPFIGDDERDAQAADAAGCPSILDHGAYVTARGNPTVTWRQISTAETCG